MALVVDASVVLKWYVAEDESTEALRLLDGEKKLIAPELVVAEVANIVWRLSRKEIMSSQRSIEVIEAVESAFAELISLRTLSVQAYMMAAAIGHPVYDCCYLALAEQRDSKLITADRKFHALVLASAWRRRIALLDARQH
jgi:predicted nucleic acid-binding protein